MADLTVFKRLIDDRIASIEKLGLSEVELNGNNEFNMLINDLVASVAIQENAAPQATLQSITGAISTAIEEPDAPLAKLYAAIVDAFANKITAGITDLSAAQEKSKTLVADMTERFDALIANNPFTREHFGIDRSKANVELKDIPWGAIEIVAPVEMIISNVNASVLIGENSGRAGVVDMSLLALAINKIDSAAFVQVTDEVMSADAKARTIEMVASALGDTVSAGRVNQLMINIFDNMAFLTRLTVAAHYRQNPETTVSDLVSGLQFIDDMDAVLTVLDQVMPELALSEATQTVILNNIALLRKVMEIQAYYAIAMRTFFLKDVYLARGGYINRDNDKAFGDAGGDVAKIATYIFVRFGGSLDAIPMPGVAADVIASEATRAEELYKQSLTNLEQKLTLAVNAYREDAFKYAVVKFCAADGCTPNSTTVDSLATRIRINNMTFEDAALTLVMDSCQNEFSVVLWKSFGAAYTNKLTEGGNLDSKTIDIIEAGVLTGMVTKFIFETMVAPAK